MAKSDARFEYQARLSRTDHDLSQKFGFTTAPGILSPIFADIATPGDSYYIKHDLGFLRTAPLIAPSMIDVKVHFESFFVPMQMIYQPFENSMFSLTEILSSNYTVADFKNQNLPLFRPDDVWLNFGAGSGNVEPKVRLDAFRLFDLLDLPTLGIPGKDDFTYEFGNFFPWQLCAYQCIYQHYYRLDDKEQFDHDAFNVDKYYSLEDYVSEIPDNLKKFIKLRYRPWKFDYFTSSYMSPIVSGANTQNVMPRGQYSSLNDNVFYGRNSATSPTENNSEKTSYSAAFNIPSGSSLSAGQAMAVINTAAIRQMFANEKLAMITGRTKKNYDSQVLAHYGVSVPHDVKHDISFIGHDEYELKVGEVTSLASTDLSPLGDLAGKGWAFGEAKKQHKFTAPCHGVVMTIFSVEPMIRYEGTAQRINFVSTALDIPVPEYDRLGNQPMFYREFDNHDTPGDILRQNAGIWKERYYCNKRRYDRVSQAFTQKPVQGFTRDLTNNYAAYFVHDTPFTIHPTSPVSYQYSENAYYINPSCLDALMLVSYSDSWLDGGTEQSPTEDYDTYPYLAFARDPFIVDSNLQVKKVSWMSKDGEPIYPY